MTYRKGLAEHGILKMTLDGENLYGRRTVPGMQNKVSARRARRASHRDIALYHRQRNGVYDAVTYYHLMDVLCRLDAGQDFRTMEIMEILRRTKTPIVWDSTTVGRVLADIVESLNDANGFTVISATRRWNGVIYAINGAPEARHAMVDLITDLEAVAVDVLAREEYGEVVKRTDSPLLACTSILMGQYRD